MRILAITLFTGVALAATSGIGENDQSSELKTADARTEVPLMVDPVVTGETLSADQLDSWEERRDKYLKCPECVASQPFPGD